MHTFFNKNRFLPFYFWVKGSSSAADGGDGQGSSVVGKSFFSLSLKTYFML
jgi:hypothetical protein